MTRLERIYKRMNQETKKNQTVPQEQTSHQPESLLREFEPDICFKAVRASHGKITRAEPVAALYEKGKVSHHGIFRELEDEMTGYSPLVSLKSPDRMDALVWALTELVQPLPRFFVV